MLNEGGECFSRGLFLVLVFLAVCSTVFATDVSFTDPTPANGSVWPGSWFVLNVSVESSDLSSFGLFWNGSDYLFGSATYSPYVNVSFSCLDNFSGCDKIIYCTDHSNICLPDAVFLSPLQINSINLTYVRYKSNDTVGNLEETQNKTVIIATITTTTTCTTSTTTSTTITTTTTTSTTTTTTTTTTPTTTTSGTTTTTIPSTCFDGIKNNGETGVDCGTVCGKACCYYSSTCGGGGVCCKKVSHSSGVCCASGQSCSTVIGQPYCI
jgi:hypothetical protein